jgi:mono/diheme cytochrome c family protein
MAGIVVLLGACAPPATPTPTLPPAPARPTNTPPPTATAIITPTAQDEAPQGAPLPTERGKLFSASGACAGCHTGMQDEGGNDVSTDRLWRSTVMANSARDPYWQASVRAEVSLRPEMRQEIESTCARCHMPMAHETALAEGEEPAVLDEGFLREDNPLHTLAMDGVSCALCHQIREEGLGLPASFNGGFVIDRETPVGGRLTFGPFTIEETQSALMQGASGYIPLQGLHLSQSEMCASCHTLYTPILNVEGEAVGEFPEQVPYLEWFYSSYRNSATCQDCHMPEADGGVRISATSTNLRSPVSRHSTVGGNVFLLEMLKAFGEELGVTASTEQFDETIAATRALLQEQTATVAVEEIRLVGDYLSAEVVIENNVGHKFPTSFPSRRAWLHITVEDAGGNLIFESGGVNPDGSIVENDNDLDPSTFEPHYQAIVQPEQVQIYEAILKDTEEDVTTSVLSAAGFFKDNRLLPWGFEKSAPYEDIQVRGEAMEDADFDAGGDRVGLALRLPSAQAPLTLEVELLYQPVGYRWAENLRGAEGEEVERFLEMYDSLSNAPVVVASVSQRIER